MTRFCHWKTETLSEFVGNKLAVQHLKDWFISLKAQKTGTKRAALIVGPCGVGKSLLAELLLSDAGYEIIRSDCGELRSQKAFKEKLENASSHSNVSKALGSHKPFALIIDDVEQMTTRSGLTELIQLLNPLRGKRSLKQAEKNWYASYWPQPVICISSCHKSDAKLAEMKKDCELISLEAIEQSCIAEAMYAIARHEKIAGMDHNLIRLVGGDFRRMLHIMSDLMMGIPTETIRKNHTRPRVQATLQENTLTIFNKVLTVQQSLKLFDEDRHQLPQMVYENYPSKVESVKDAQQALENLCLADSLNKLNPELDTIDEYAKLQGLLTIYCCNTIFARCKRRLTVPKATTMFSRTSAMHVTLKKLASMLSTGTYSNLHMEDLQILFALLHNGKIASSDEIGIQQIDLDKLATKIPFLHC